MVCFSPVFGNNAFVKNLCAANQPIRQQPDARGAGLVFVFVLIEMTRQPRPQRHEQLAEWFREPVDSAEAQLTLPTSSSVKGNIPRLTGARLTSGSGRE